MLVVMMMMVRPQLLRKRITDAQGYRRRRGGDRENGYTVAGSISRGEVTALAPDCIYKRG